jgi:hypothetical protein
LMRKTESPTLSILIRMKKIVLLASLLMAFSLGYAQDKSVELGLQVGLNVATNSVESNYFQNSGSGVRLSGGLVADFFLAEHYAFSTGLRYTIKRSGFENTSGATQSSFYNHQTLQLPISLKLFTSEISQDTRLYFQVGGTLDFKLAEKPLDKSTNFLYISTQGQDRDVFKTLGAGLLLAAGVELQLTDTNKCYIGLAYNRGLTENMGSATSAAAPFDGAQVKQVISSFNHLIGIELGVKF